MCEECHRVPCAAACPNAPPPKPISICEACGDDICIGDVYYGYPTGVMVCESCVENLTACEVLMKMGFASYVAGEDI